MLFHHTSNVVDWKQKEKLIDHIVGCRTASYKLLFTENYLRGMRKIRSGLKAELTSKTNMCIQPPVKSHRADFNKTGDLETASSANLPYPCPGLYW
jgi:hypothetical protein